GLSAEANWDINDAMTLTSVTAWRNWRAETGQDADFTAADLVYRPNDGRNNVEFEQFSQELRLAGDAIDGRLNWLVGGFYAKEDLSTRAQLLFGEDYYAYYAQRVLQNVPALIGLTQGTILQPGAGSDDRHDQEGE